MTNQGTNRKLGKTARLILSVVVATSLAIPAGAWASPSSEPSTPAPMTSASVKAASTVGAQSDLPKVSVDYEVKLKGTGWTEEMSDNEVAGGTDSSFLVRSLKASLGLDTSEGGIKYRAHLSSGSWTAWKSNGKATAASSKLDGIQIVLTGPVSDQYDVVYRAYVDGIGWQRRMRNGETAGVAGSAKQVEALRIEVVAKSEASGWVSTDGTWSYYDSGTTTKSSWLDTTEHPIDTALAGSQRYWLDADGNLAVSRYIDPTTNLDAAAGLTAYATPQGYIALGKYTNSDGLLLADTETGALYTETRWLTTKKFDGKKQRYHLLKVGPAAIAQTGLFKVGKKKYYGWEDGRGYVLRSNIWYIGKKWYKANSKGVLKKYKGKTTKIIDRYVKWAVKIAKNNSHGYSQANRWGPDYDCSSLVCSALLKTGFPNSGATWTGNMKSRLKKIGFKWHKGTQGLRRGDILLVHNSLRQHTEIYIGNNRLVGAHIAETGGVYGKTGDQTGNEISVTQYYNAPWQGYLRYKG